MKSKGNCVISSRVKASARRLVFASLVMAFQGSADSFVIPETVLQQVARDYGPVTEARLRDWQKMINHTDISDDLDKLTRVNSFINNANQINGIERWRKSDAKADPMEFLINYVGDGQAFTMTKLFTLQQMGMAPSKLRVGYVKSRISGQSHTVLAYFSTPDAEPLILDNIDKEIKMASLRVDLEPIYLVDAGPLFGAADFPFDKPIQPVAYIIEWQDLLPNLEAVHY